MLEFASSTQSTLGIEWEVALVDRASGAMIGAAPELFEVLTAPHRDLIHPEGLTPHLTREFLANTIEMVTGVNERVGEAVEQLAGMVEKIRRHTDPLGVEIFSAGTHPLARWEEQVISDKERYRKVLERTQYWGYQMMIYGVHVHVGVDSRDKALPTVNHLVNHYGHLLALSANSPFWQGHDTGYASQRAMIFQQIPTSGMPYLFQRWEEFEQYTRDLMDTGVIEEDSENRWDVRPVPRYGTVEMRICDGASTLQEIGAVAALTQCLAEEASRTVEAGGTIPVLRRWNAEENKWRAARYGLDAEVILDPSNREAPLREEIPRMLDRLAPLADDLGCAEELAEIERILERGTGAERQRRVAARHDGDLRAVVRDLTRLTRTGY
ncbi:glutamate--cysteine ligase [Rothia kristinae]|uniref:glutamate--cysteine ligase n=1 Tax=Rothia kristinae TaxID=37923 RepID=UPI002448591E|nr:glutamate--cysteine ligase [Rothia kristinae]WGH09940.1 glutamate--cysteine ligase [Rothia kristinae]